MQLNIVENTNTEMQHALKLYKYGYLPGPISCECGANCFKIYADSSYKVNGCSFRCGNNKCRRKFPITINSFYDKFSKQKLSVISEIIKCFIIFDFNAVKTFNYINNELKTFVSKKIIPKVFNEIKKIISKFLKINYQSGLLGEKNQNKYFSIDETLINHIEGKQVW